MSVLKHIWLTGAERSLTGNTALRELGMHACVCVMYMRIYLNLAYHLIPF
jgi:hypothetical protein